MLKKIFIKNIALIPELEIELSEGLNVLSGETGAGKSIIIDSLNFVLGIKTDKTLVRHGEKQAMVEAVFDLPDDCVSILEEIGIEPDEILIITRTITADGRTDSRLNGRSVSLSMLRRITPLLVDIHGQHEHQAILKASNHLSILDGFNPEIARKKTAVASLYAEYKNLNKELGGFGGTDADRERAADLLKYQIDEIKKAKINAAEEEELKAKRLKLLNVAKINSAVQSSLGYLNSNPAHTLPELLSLSANSLFSISEYDKGAEELAQRLKSARIEINDIIDGIEELASSLDYDGDEADEIESRLNIYKSLCRKYGGSVEAVLEFFDKASSEYDRLMNSAEHIEKLKAAILKAENSLFKECAALTELRKKTAAGLSEAVIKELSGLGMNSIIEVVFNEYTRDNFTGFLSANGADNAEFYFSANKGEPLKPLVKVISGGEMSRFMLAIKSIIADVDSIPSMVFDEIDTGISGKIGQVVAIKLGKIASRHQVICVTHLPQIASMADSHYLIAKFETENKTITKIELLDKNGELEEISRLSGGKGISELAIGHAKELKNWSDGIKAQYRKD